MLFLSYFFCAVFVVACCVGLGSFLWAIFFLLKMTSYMSDSEGGFSQKTLWNPMNVVLRPGLLSPEGMVYRRRALYGGLIFVISVALAGAIGLGFQAFL
jgi:hypothetical protein